MPSEYEFSSNSKPYKGFKIEVPDCTITGNSSQFVLKDNSIMVYNLDSEGNVVSSQGENKEAVALTKYQLSIFELLKGRDGNENDFDKDDLKGLSEEELTKLINEKFAPNGVYSVNSVKLKRRSLKVQLNETINGKITIKNLEIEFDKVGLFKSLGNFFKNLFTSDKPKAVIEVGDLEEVAVLPSEEEKVDEAAEKKGAEEVIESKESKRSERITRREQRRAERAAKKEKTTEVAEVAENLVLEIVDGKKIVNLPVYFKNNPYFDVIPQREHKVTGQNKDELPFRYASVIGVSLDRLKAANPGKNMDWKQEIGSSYIIPEDYKIKSGSIKSVEDIANAVGLSQSYIEDIVLGLEGRDKELPYLTPYYDNVKSKNSGKKGVLTIGFGHTNRISGKYIKGCENENELYEMNSKNMNNINITLEQAYEILAQDLLAAKMDAILYFGKDFLEAPQSIQDAIVDIVFNKGVDTGLKKSGSDAKSSPTNNLYQNILEGDYVEAAKNTLYATNLQGLKKRNVYRFIVAIKDLPQQQREEAMASFEEYYNSVKTYFAKKGIEGKLLERAWNNALNGVCEDFFTEFDPLQSLQEPV